MDRGAAGDGWGVECDGRVEAGEGVAESEATFGEVGEGFGLEVNLRIPGPTPWTTPWIAAGIASGLQLGDNAISALVTRALAEMTRLGVALGGRVETFAGLSGVGDLIGTCFSVHSRNHRVGLALGQGKSLEEAVGALGMVAEGVPNTLSIHEAARTVGVRTPIIDAVHAILYQEMPAAWALSQLLNRDPRPEKE